MADDSIPFTESVRLTEAAGPQRGSLSFTPFTTPVRRPLGLAGDAVGRRLELVSLVDEFLPR